MARSFTVDGSTNDYTTVAAQGFTAWAFGTVFSCHRHNGTFPVSDASTFLVIGTPAQDFVELYMTNGGLGSGGKVGLWTGAASRTGTSVAVENRWILHGATKATGTTTPRAHLFDFTTGTWIHENMTGTLADASGTAATEHSVGFNASFGANSCTAYVAAVAAWKRDFTDSECERLARGLWELWSPDLLMEFPSGRDHLTRTTIDCSRNRMRQSGVGSQVVRGNIAPPPGFRHSALNRRR